MDRDQLLQVFKERFEQNMNRHEKVNFDEFVSSLSEHDLDMLEIMEEQEREPDLLVTPHGNKFLVDTFTKMPDDRRSVCYDEDARLNRKKYPPEHSAWGIIQELSEDLELMDEEVYFALQSTGDFDVKGQVWIKAPADFRKKGDGLFGCKRHQRTFIYFNGAQSYYQSCGFRMMYRLD